jgi:anaerobic C4-dicarboxylate transporter
VSGLQHFGWDLYLLVVSLALVWVGARVRARGLGYVGGVGLLAFLVSAGVQITRLESGREPTTSLIGWPLALLVIGIVGLAAPALDRRDS